MSAHLEDRLKELDRLPALSPPDTLEERTLAAMAEAAAPRRMFSRARAAVWLAVAGAGVMLGAMVLDLEPASEQAEGVSDLGSEPATTATTATSTAPTTPATEPARSQTADESVYTQLAAQATYLEQVLAAMPQRSVMRVSTAGTIAGLEDQLAVIDAELGRAASAQYRTLLMQNRVEVMNALVNVRYSQSTAFAY